jgi:hypothetical protein
LKTFGFSIHGCIDGFSRRLIWLEVGPTNKNPQVIGKYYLDAILQIGGVPQKMRSDDGTENSIVEALQILNFCDHNIMMNILVLPVFLLARLHRINE